MTPNEVELARTLLCLADDWRAREEMFRRLLVNGTFQPRPGQETHNILHLVRFIEDNLIPNEVADKVLPIVRGALIDYAAASRINALKELRALGVEVPNE